MSYSTKKYLSFDRVEQRSLLITVLILSFILSFSSWGVDTFDAHFGLRQLVLTIILVTISLFAKVAVQKWLGIRVGIHVEYHGWIVGLLLGILFVFMTNGGFIFLAVGGAMYSTIERLRIGREYAISNKALSWISFSGILTSIVIAGLAKILISTGLFSEVVLLKLMGINIWFAFYSMLPIPLINTPHNITANDGLTILYSSRLAYVATVLITLLSIGFIAYSSLIVGVIVTAVVTAIVWLVYYFQIESGFSK